MEGHHKMVKYISHSLNSIIRKQRGEDQKYTKAVRKIIYTQYLGVIIISQ